MSKLLAREFKFHPPAKYATPRNPEWETEGHEIARVALLMGFKLQPWQRQVVDVATEYKLDTFGRRIYHYEKVLVTVPRQSGKTTLMGPVRVHRAITRPDITMFCTAQTGQDAGKRVKDMLDILTTSPASPLFKPRYANGSEGFTCIGNGSMLTRFSPSPSALHGETPYLVDFDEIWKYTELLGDAMLGGADPGMITLDGQGQIYMVSTMGTLSSTFMNKWIEKGREGKDPDLAYFEWSMPAGADPDDPATWWQFHPALGNTITERSLAKRIYADGVSKAERLRAYMNILTDAEEPIIYADVWEELARDVPAPEWDKIAVAFEVAPGNSCSAVAAAWRDPEGVPVVRILHQAPGVSWLPGYLRDIKDRFNPGMIGADGAGPVDRIADALTRDDEDLPEPERLNLRRLKFGEYAQASMTLISEARDERQLAHDGSKVLAAAVASAAVRVSNGVERIDRDKSLAPVPSLIAAAIALWLADHREEEIGLQIF